MVNTKTLRLLLIENNSIDASRVSAMLHQHCEQLKINHVSKMEEAIKNLDSRSFDAVLLNLSLQDSQGINSLDRVQQKAPQLPIIILTTDYNANLAVESLRKGAQDYLIKQELQGEMLTRSIQYAIERQRIEFNERQQVLMKRMVDKIRTSIDLETILKTTVREIQQFLNTEQVLIYHYESDRPEDISVISSSLDDKLAQFTVAQFISSMNLYSSSNFKSQLVGTKAIEDITIDPTPEGSISNIKPARSYLSLPIYVGESNDYSFKDLTYPIIQEENIPESSGELWGMLIAYNTKAVRKWQNWEIKFLQKLTTQVTIAIKQSQQLYRLQTANQKLQQLAILDGLTDIANRRYFDLVLNNEWKRLTREQQPLSLILCDVDYFKAYNDTYGHQQGDRCLQKLAQTLQKNIKRSTDLAARYGGEEFAIILPNTDAKGALHVAQKIKLTLANQKLPHIKSSVSEYVTCSMGIATIIPNLQQSVMSLVKTADQLLYEAKTAGRDRIVVSGQKNFSAPTLDN